jgi:dTDP-4-amino-4,6-dideoxygalactose transaminase
MDEILAIARRHGLRVIEDAAQAHAAEHHGLRCGSLGDLACFSFYPSKNLGCYGDGGMVTGSDPALLTRIRRLRDHGRVGKYEHVELGWGSRLDALQAAILGAKLPHLEGWTEQRRMAAQLGATGGKARSRAKAAAARENGRKGGRPPRRRQSA